MTKSRPRFSFSVLAEYLVGRGKGQVLDVTALRARLAVDSAALRVGLVLLTKGIEQNIVRSSCEQLAADELSSA